MTALSTIEARMLAKALKSANHQYSGRAARP
jgi:hypothetical protein